MFCVKCGAENPDTGNFCRKCGAHLRRPRAADKLPSEKHVSPAASAVKSSLQQSAEVVISLPSNIAGLLCYTLGWISGVALLLLKKDDAFVRFHAWQSIITFTPLCVLLVLLNLLTASGAVYWPLVLLYWLVVLLGLFLWVFLMLKAYQGQTYRLPAIGGVAERFSRMTP